MIILKNATIVNEGNVQRGYVVVDGDTISLTGDGDVPFEPEPCAEVIDLEGRYLLPGVIDTHVHFREPGLTEKGDIATESAAAAAGGVTSVIEMPNTRPATVTHDDWEWKMNRAAEVSAVNYAFFLGATNDNLDFLKSADYEHIPGVKVFMGSSTGGMLVDNEETLRRVFAEVPALIAVHAESEDIIKANKERLSVENGGGIPLESHYLVRSREACVRSTAKAIELARATGARLHITHITTAEELKMLTPGFDVAAKEITAETCPHYLLFTADDLKEKGARLKCNPAIKEERDRLALIDAIKWGRIDTVATDHAPHLLASKEGDALTAASGMPGVQFSLPLMMDFFMYSLCGSLANVARLMCHNPSLIYGIQRRGFIRPGYYADFAIVEEVKEGYTVKDDDVVSRCRWTPYAGMVTHFRVTDTMVNGRWVMRGASLGNDLTGAAKPLVFKNRTIQL